MVLGFLGLTRALGWTQESCLLPLYKPRNWARADRAGAGVMGFGPGRVAQVASPGSPKKPEIKPEELSLLFIKSEDITHIFQNPSEP